MENKRIIIKDSRLKALDRRHPWIFSMGIHIDKTISIEAGESVSIYTRDGHCLGHGYYEEGSIAVRILSFDKDKDINTDEFWRNLLEEALDVRRSLDLVHPGSIYRLIHGEGDYIPGLIIDIYGDIAVLQAHTVGIHKRRKMIAEQLIAITQGSLKCVYYKSETTLPGREENHESSGILAGEWHDPICDENGIRIVPDILKGQKTGFFIDQRENRSLLERYSSGRNVLNMFCYTGGFSLYALRGGAKQVTSVDSSAKAIDLTKSNVTLNFDAAIASRHEAHVADAFKYLEVMKHGAYDLIVLDPPAFAKHRGVLHNALQGYRRINAEAISKLPEGGILFTFSCSQAVSPIQFRQAVFTAALSAGRSVRILETLGQPADHPISMYHPEGEYLKGLVLYVGDKL
ncbi:class I SAM-dependent rRNA methyltransferase [Porphyromonas sp.]|uniref:class I SAM-dependent rRNA methyltransferase n=1 Tax=Porphyromonas sp. TaxID=1924944 RepID=UPI0026DC74CD|nr:class I SAM-dependent rRNA methyltransferase [Porphyromonas sp.]MDO4695226.1 class I SAM-dependent rRNA methyltransferase [Porphyromonas sp.]MDO4770972.1 class I SAM-dependent rRNA methyltransferase [Porphyromonas sp.]